MIPMGPPHISPPKAITPQSPPLLAPGVGYIFKSTPNRVSPAYSLCLTNVYRDCLCDNFSKQVKMTAEPRIRNKELAEEERVRDIHRRQLVAAEAAMRKSFEARDEDTILRAGPSLTSERRSTWAKRGIITSRRFERMSKIGAVGSLAKVFEWDDSGTLVTDPSPDRKEARLLLRDKRRKLVYKLLATKPQSKKNEARLCALSNSAGTGPDCKKLIAAFERRHEMKWLRNMRAWRLPWPLEAALGIQGLFRTIVEIGNIVYEALEYESVVW